MKHLLSVTMPPTLWQDSLELLLLWDVVGSDACEGSSGSEVQGFQRQSTGHVVTGCLTQHTTLHHVQSRKVRRPRSLTPLFCALAPLDSGQGTRAARHRNLGTVGTPV